MRAYSPWLANIAYVYRSLGRYAESETLYKQARPDKIKALIAVEPTLGGDKGKVASIKNSPVLVIYGDNAKDHPRWSKIRAGGVAYFDVLKGAGGSVDVVDLPDVGIRGNSHMMMMDRNSDQIAELIQKWLVSKELAD